MGNSTTRESLRDKGYDGSDYLSDPALKDGPLQNRKCTDVLFLVLFLVTLGGYGWTGAYAAQHGKPRQLFTPVDGDGRLCGYDKEVKSYPFLYYVIRHDAPMPRAVCVDKCPLEAASAFKCKPTKTIPSVSICEKEYAKTGKGHVGYGTNRVLHRFCLPDIDKLPPGVDLDAYDDLIGNFGLDDVQEYAEDIEESKAIYYYAFVTCVIVTLLYSLLIFKCAGLIVWISIISTGLGIAAAAFYLNTYRAKHYGSTTQTAKGQATKEQNVGTALQYACYGLYGLAGVYFFAICCLYKDIAVSVAVLRTAAVVVVKNLRVLLLPLCSALLVLFWSGCWLAGFGFLLSTGDIKQPKLGSQLKVVTLNDQQWLMVYLQVFVFFWVYELIQAIFSYVVIVAVATWYFTCTADASGTFSLAHGFWWSFRYNLGSLVLGSFILAVVWIIRIVFEYVEEQLEKSSHGNKVVEVVGVCVSCCLDCFQRFIKFLNANAYIQMALTGDSFCSSAMNAFVLALKNAGTFAITNGAGALLEVLGKLSISVGNTAICYLILEYNPEFEELESPVPPLALCFILSFMLARVFMDVYGTTSLTLLQCLYVDVDLQGQKGEDKFDNPHRPPEMDSIVAMLRVQ